MKKYLTLILIEMCNRVGTDFDSVDFKKDNWYFDHTWTEEEQDNFTNWLTDLLYNDPAARKEIMQFPLKNRKKCRGVAQRFTDQYGWETV